MRGHSTTPRPACITTRLSPDEKRRFAILATSRGLSESRLALIAIRELLQANGLPEEVMYASGPEPATDRITIRLRPGDRRIVNERAARRGLKASGYLAALVRSHITANPPLATGELAAVKQGVVILAGLGRLLAQLSRNSLETGTSSPELQHELGRTRAVVAALEQRTHDLARAALKSWESRSD